MLLSVCITFYTNYLALIDRFLYKNRWIVFILINVVIFVFINILNDFLRGMIDMHIDMPRPHFEHPHGRRNIFLLNDVIFYVLGIGAALGVRYYKHLAETEKALSRLEAEKLSSELSLLKYQIQPHFFFNVLNSIYALIGTSPESAKKAVHNLSKMMRYILYDNDRKTIALSEEIEFMQNYINLMKLRIGDKVETEFVFPEHVEGTLVPPLLFIPLLENAFKHAGATKTNASYFIHSRMAIEEKTLIFTIENTVGATEGRREDLSASGIGLSNLQKRLKILYNDRFSIDIEQGESLYKSTLKLPL